MPSLILDGQAETCSEYPTAAPELRRDGNVSSIKMETGSTAETLGLSARDVNQL